VAEANFTRGVYVHGKRVACPPAESIPALLSTVQTTDVAHRQLCPLRVSPRGFCQQRNRMCCALFDHNRSATQA